MSEVKKQLEALLFSSGKAMEVTDLMAVTGFDKRKVKKELAELKKDYESRDSSLMLMEEGNSWKLNIRENYVSLVTKIISDTELSRGVLETLGVVAWKAPVLQSEVIHIRSASAYDQIKELVELSFIKKEKEGRSYILKLTEKFFEYFDVPGDKGIKDALGDIKQPEPVKPIEKLDNLDVVNIGEVKTEEESKLDQAKKELENQFDIVSAEEDRASIPEIDNDFLSKINDKIDNISKRNDAHESDELFQRTDMYGEQLDEIRAENRENEAENASEGVQESQVEESNGEQVESEADKMSDIVKEIAEERSEELDKINKGEGSDFQVPNSENSASDEENSETNNSEAVDVTESKNSETKE